MLMILFILSVTIILSQTNKYVKFLLTDYSYIIYNFAVGYSLMKGGDNMLNDIIHFFLSVIAGVISNYISRLLNRKCNRH